MHALVTGLEMVCKMRELLMRRLFPFLFLGLLAGGLATSAHAAFSLGIDELEKSNFRILQGKRVGLVTNPSGADSKGRSAIDVLYHGGKSYGFRLVKLFGPEHGIDGQVGAGKDVSNSRDPHTGLPVYALFQTPRGDYRHPSPEMFEGLDVVVYDVQDLGNRSYTFISTLGNVMDQAAKSNVEVVVLDRPNPLGGIRIEGPRLDPALKSFVGMYNIPLVYGLTPGELARWINARYLERSCRLTVVAMKGWSRGMVWEDTHLHWIPTSPNIPTVAAARGYTATGMLGEVGIESGVGGPAPFQMVGGSGWDREMLAERFNALRIPGVRALPYEEGIFLQIDPHNAGNLTAISYQAIEILRRYVRGFVPFAHTKADQRQMFDKCTGTSSVRQALAAGRPVSSIVRSWNSGVAEWAVERLPYLIYSTQPSTSMMVSNPATP
jgi:uncharacterized protein YbbC (DUF1343 family)